MPRGISRYDDAARQGRLWTPMATRASLALWFDDDYRPSLDIDSSCNVNNWYCRATGIAATQVTAGDRPPYSPAGWYGGPMINANLDELSGSVTIGGADLTVYVVASTKTGTAYGHRLISCASASGSADWDTIGEFAIARGPSDNEIVYSRNVNDLVVAVGALGTRWLYVIENDNANNLVTAYPNGGSGTSMAMSGTWSIGHFRIGSYSLDGTIRWVGEWAEIILDKAIPSKARRTRIEGYLAHKNWNRWGRENTLPSYHPYKNRPPLIGA